MISQLLATLLIPWPVEVDVYYHLFMVIITIVTIVYMGNKTTYNT
jgi:hypothetical protein